mgnify:CR=1 FL=1
MRKICGLSIIILLIISTIVGVNNIILVGKTKRSSAEMFYEAMSILNKKKEMESVLALNESKTNALNFENLVKYLKELIGDYGEFPLKEGGDGYVNATYFGILSLYLLGHIEESSEKRKLSQFMALLYDNTTGGFRDWLGGEISIKSTALALLIMSIAHIKFDEFNATKTEEFILNRTDETGIREVYSDKADLVTTAMGIIALKLLNSTNANFESLLDVLMNYYDETRGFFDQSVHESEILQQYYTIKAIWYADPNRLNDQIKSDLVNIFLNNYKYNGNDTNLLGGFGSNPNTPSVFETGISLEILRLLGFLNETIFNESIIFVNNSQATFGAIKENPSSSKYDVFQAAGALLTYYATEKIENLIEVSHTIIPSEQVPIDYENMQIRIRLNILREDIDFFDVRYTIIEKKISGSLAFDNISTYYTNLKPSEIGFGNFTVEIIAKPEIYGLVGTKKQYYLSFRVGYKIDLRINATEIKPSQSISIALNVTYGNGTSITNGFLIIVISRASNIYLKRAYELNGSIETTWNTSIDIPLGYYEVLAFVNDSHGYNHTRAVSSVKIIDELKYEILEKPLKEYYLGSEVSVTIEARYNYSNALVPPVAILNATYEYREGGIYFAGNATWISDGTIKINAQIPPRLPDKKDIVAMLRFIWESDIKHEYELFRLNISVKDLLAEVYHYDEKVAYGDYINISIRLISNNTGVLIENASLYAKIINTTEGENATLQMLRLWYNETSKVYHANNTIDPNIPSGTYTTNIKLYLPFNKSEITIHTQPEQLLIEIIGTLKITSWSTPQKIYTKSDAIIKFSVVCVDNEKLITGLLLQANVTAKDYNYTVLAAEISNAIYQIVFTPPKAGKYNITVYRVSDKMFLGSLLISVSEKPSPHIEPIELYGAQISAVLIILAVLAYLILGAIITRKIPRRYLVKRIRKRGGS